jgi:CubicO group peptidase (beta-lactamase class C family)
MTKALSARPNRRMLLTTGSAALLAKALPGSATAARPADMAEPIINAMVRDHGFQGVVILGRNGVVRFARAIGSADIGNNVPMAVDTPFGIASISKRLTAVAVMRLVERKQLSLDAPIITYLRQYRADTGAKISLRHLLSNSSGVPSQFLTAAREDPSLLTTQLTTAEAIRRFASGDFIFEPGARFDYALTNWVLVTGILEAVMGQPYPELMRELVIRPLGLAATTLDLPPHAAKSYRTLSPPDEWMRPRLDYMAAGGGYFSTAPDMLRFGHAVYGSGFLSRASRLALTKIEVASDSYALGGRVREVAIGDRKRIAAWDTGNTAGYRSVLGDRLDGKGTVVILNNSAMSQRTMDEFADALLQVRI